MFDSWLASILAHELVHEIGHEWGNRADWPAVEYACQTVQALVMVQLGWETFAVFPTWPGINKGGVSSCGR